MKLYLYFPKNVEVTRMLEVCGVKTQNFTSGASKNIKLAGM